MDGGHGVSRKAVMHNDFIVVGPADDPAGIKGAGSAAEAFTRIATAEAPFASRADESGTNTKELSLWEAGGHRAERLLVHRDGAGDGRDAHDREPEAAYTLSDRGTFLATKNLDLKLLVEGGKDLLNPYHVIVVKARARTAPARRSSRTGSSPRRPRGDRALRRRQVRRAALHPRREELMDTVPRCSAARRWYRCSATAIALALGVPFGTWLALGRRRGRGALATAVNTGMAIPTVVVGLARGAAALAQRPARQPRPDLHAARDDHRPGPDRRAADRRDHDGGPAGACRLSCSDQLRALGANTPQLVWRLWIEARVPLLAAAMAGFGHAISEVGAATIVGGNIHGQTQVMTTSIVEQRRQGRLQRGARLRRESCSRSPS